MCYMDIKVNLQQGMSQKFEEYELGEDEILMYRCRVYVPCDHGLKSMIFLDMHKCWVCVKIFWADIFSPISSRHIIAGPTYFWDDIFPGPHDIRWFSAHGFCRWFSISG
jgi:hypothetical protein